MLKNTILIGQDNLVRSLCTECWVGYNKEMDAADIVVLALHSLEFLTLKKDNP